MYHVVGDLQLVRRFGRWASDAFHVYLWEAHEPQAGLAAAMARDGTTLTRAPLGPGIPRPHGDGPPDPLLRRDPRRRREGRAGCIKAAEQLDKKLQIPVTAHVGHKGKQDHHRHIHDQKGEDFDYNDPCDQDEFRGLCLVQHDGKAHWGHNEVKITNSLDQDVKDLADAGQ